MNCVELIQRRKVGRKHLPFVLAEDSSGSGGSAQAQRRSVPGGTTAQLPGKADQRHVKLKIIGTAPVVDTPPQFQST